MLLAHLSDLHIMPPGEKLYDFIDTNELLARHIARLNKHPETPDALVITGDITNCGSKAAYGVAKRLLAQLDMDLYLLPGNHDNNENFLEAFGEDYKLPTNPRQIGYTVETFTPRLVFLDTSVDGELHGDIGSDRLAWLSQTLAEQPVRPTALFMHHHPIESGCMHMDTILCRDGEDLLRMLEQFPQVRQLFCGHTHRTIFQQYQNLLIVTAPGAAHQVPYNSTDPDGYYNMEPPSMLMHRYNEKNGLITYVESLDLFHGPFRFDCTPPCYGEPEE